MIDTMIQTAPVMAESRVTGFTTEAVTEISSDLRQLLADCAAAPVKQGDVINACRNHGRHRLPHAAVCIRATSVGHSTGTPATSRVMPSLRMRAIKVVRGRPSRAAAPSRPPTIHFVFSSVSRI